MSIDAVAVLRIATMLEELRPSLEQGIRLILLAHWTGRGVEEMGEVMGPDTPRSET
jgi:hypothetical protein